MSIFSEYHGHIVPLAAPKADRFASSFVTDYVSLKEYNHATLLVHMAASTNSTTNTLTVRDAATSTGATTKISFRYRQAANGETWGAVTTATSAGFAIAATTAQRLIAIEVDAAETQGYIAVAVADTSVSSAVVAGVAAILTEGRYPSDNAIAALD